MYGTGMGDWHEMTESLPKTPQTPFRFLDLPQEVQNQVFGELLPSSYSMIAEIPPLPRMRNGTRDRDIDYSEYTNEQGEPTRFRLQGLPMCEEVLVSHKFHTDIDTLRRERFDGYLSLDYSEDWGEKAWTKIQQDS